MIKRVLFINVPTMDLCVIFTLFNLHCFKCAQCCFVLDGHIQWLIHYKFLH